MQKMSRISRLLAWATALGVVVCLGSPLRAQQPVTLETIIQAWKERQERVKSARIEWRERETVPQGALSESWKARGDTPEELEKRGIRPGAIVPPRDTTYEAVSTVSLDGEKIRLECEDHQWSGRENTFVLSPFISVYDGKLGTTLRTRSGEDQKPQASLGGGYTNYMDGPYMRAVALVYRPFIPRVSPVNLAAFTISGRQPVVNGKACLELERALPGGVVHRVWVDPSLRFVPVRSMFQAKSRTTSKLDLVYSRAPGGSFDLKGWELNRFDRDGRLKRANRVQEIKVEINSAVPLSAFHVEFPSGTVVVDETTPGTPVIYRIDDRGKKGEDQAAFGTLSKTGTSETPWLAIVLGALGLLTGCWFVWRRIAFRK